MGWEEGHDRDRSSWGGERERTGLGGKKDMTGTGVDGVGRGRGLG